MSEARGTMDRVDTRPQDFTVGEREVIAALRTENAALKERLEAMREIATGTHATMTEIYDAMHVVLGAGPHPPCCDKHAPLNYGDCPSGPCACGCGDEP